MDISSGKASNCDEIRDKDSDAEVMINTCTKQVPFERSTKVKKQMKKAICKTK